MTTTTAVPVDPTKLNNLLAIVCAMCAGPQEAFAVLIATMIEISNMNIEITGESITRGQLADEISEAVRTATVGESLQ